MGFTGGVSGKEPACPCQRCKTHGFKPWVDRIPWRREWQPTPVFTMEKIKEPPQETKTELSYDPAIPLLDIYKKKPKSLIQKDP